MLIKNSNRNSSTLKKFYHLSNSHIRLTFFAHVVALLLGSACDSYEDIPKEITLPVESDANAPLTEVIPEPDDEASYLFSADTIRTFELRLSKKNLTFLDSNPQAEQYVEGEVEFEGQTVSPVGIRYKGSIGAFAPCTAGFSGSKFGAKSCPKLSMKVKINWEDPEARLFGLKKLQFHAMNQDSSCMREQLGYHMYREMGIAAPRTAYVRLLINGKLEGLFLLVEQIDGRFTRSHFQEGGKGNLYKEVWPIHNNPKPYQNALRTNEDENPSFDRPLTLARELTNAAPEDLPAIVEYWMDTEYTLRYIAVDRIIGHNDGPMHWYCGMTGAQGNNPGKYGNHNYYWYESEDSDRFWLIPWDLDMALGGNPSTALKTPWNNRQPNCKSCPMFGQRPAACDPLIYTWGDISGPYEEAVAELISGPFSTEVVDGLLNKWSELIDSAVKEASGLQGHITVSAWQKNIKSLRTIINRQRERMSKLLQGNQE